MASGVEDRECGSLDSSLCLWVSPEAEFSACSLTAVPSVHAYIGTYTKFLGTG